MTQAYHTRTEMENAIDERITGRNAERNRAILKRRLIDGVKYERLAEEFQLSVKQVQRVVYSGSRIVFLHREE